MVNKEIAERAYSASLDEEFKESQEHGIDHEAVEWDALANTKKYELLEIVEKGGDATRFGKHVTRIINEEAARAASEVPASEVPATDEAEINADGDGAADQTDDTVDNADGDPEKTDNADGDGSTEAAEAPAATEATPPVQPQPRRSKKS